MSPLLGALVTQCYVIINGEVEAKTGFFVGRQVPTFCETFTQSVKQPFNQLSSHPAYTNCTLSLCQAMSALRATKVNKER